MRGLVRVIVLCTFSWVVVVSALGQELLKAGPFGKPVLVMDEAGHWSIPISVYSDSDVELFIPDITAPAWVAWHTQEFREKGTYSVTLFSDYKKDHLCRTQRIVGHTTDPKYLEVCKALRYERMLVSVDTRKNTVTLVATILMGRDAQPWNSWRPLNQTVPLSSVPHAAAYTRISTIVAKEVSDFKGATAQQIMENNRNVMAKMAEQQMSPDGQQGCPNATPEELRNWHNVGCPPKPAQPGVMVPAGTVVMVRMNDRLSSKTAHVGDSFNGTLIQPVAVNGVVVIPSGAEVSGSVNEAVSVEGWQVLSITLDSIHGSRPVKTSPYKQAHKVAGRMTVFLTQGNNCSPIHRVDYTPHNEELAIPAGSTVSFRIAEATRVTPVAAPAAANPATAPPTSSTSTPLYAQPVH